MHLPHFGYHVAKR